MANPWKKRALEFNRRRAENDEKAQDLLILLRVLPQGVRKQLLRDEVCAAVLDKYGMGEQN